MHRVVAKLIFKATMLPNLIHFISEIKSYASKQKAILTKFEKKNNFNPLYL
jgi:dihydroorotase